MAFIKNTATGLTWEVTQDQADHYLKFERDVYVEGSDPSVQAAAEDESTKIDHTPETDDHDLEKMEYTELQALAKSLNLASNKKAVELIADIKALLDTSNNQ